MKERKKTSPIWKLSNDQFQKLVKESQTIGQILAFFGMSNRGGNYKTLKNRFIKDNIDISKFSANSQKGRYFHKKIPLEKILQKNSSYSRNHLKKRLLDDGLLENKCHECGQLPEWNGKKLVMVLDHIDGTHNDNRFENLRLLCPNCNSQAPTFAGKQKRKLNNCIKCGVVIKIQNSYCHECCKILPRLKSRRVDRPNKETLHKMLWEKPTTKIAKEFGVSDKAIDRWAKSYDINKPPRGYWTKYHSKLNGPVA